MKPGAYRVHARAVVQRRGADRSSLNLDTLTVALVTTAPKPEGSPLNEISAPDYRRQAFAAEGEHDGTVLSSREVRFSSALDWPQATHAAIFTDDGEVLACGRLETSAGHAGPDEIVFAASSILLQLN